VGRAFSVLFLLVAACELDGLREHPRPEVATTPGDEPPPAGQGGSGDAEGGASGTSAPTGGRGGRAGSGSGGSRGSGGAGGQPVPADAGAAGASGSGGAAATTPTGPGVMINGQFVAKEKAVVFIHFGHSNMAGLADVPQALEPYFFTTAPRLWSYQGGGKFVAAKEPTAPDPPVHLGAGPGMGWLRAAAAAAGPDYNFISIGRGKGSAPSPDFMKGGLYYSSFMDRAIQLKGKVTFGGVFIMLGITERHMPLNQQDGFTDRIAQIVADIRADLGEPTLPVLHTDYELGASGELAVDGPVGTKLRPLILALPKKVTNLAIIPTNDLPMLDDHHFDMMGHKIWTERGVQIMVDRGWFPYK
jgi:hypothetical protein